MSRKRKRDGSEEKNSYEPVKKRSKLSEDLDKQAEILDDEDGEKLSNLSEIEREQHLFHKWEKDQDKKHGHNPSITLAGRGSSHITSGYKKFEAKSSSSEEEKEEEKKVRKPPQPKTISASVDDEDDLVIDQNESFSEDDEDLDDDDGTLRRRKTKPRKSSSRSSRSSRDHRRIQIVEYATLKSCVLSRKKLLKCYEEPYFPRMCINSFVRVFLGNNPKSGDPVYRLAQIDKVKEYEKGYFCDELRRKLYKLLILKIGSSLKSFKIVHISNDVPTQREYKYWYRKIKEEFKQSKVRKLPTEKSMKKHHRENIDNIRMRYRHTNEEITQKISNRIEKGQYTEMTTFELDQLAISLRNRISVLREESDDSSPEAAKARKTLEAVQKERDRKRLINQRHGDNQRLKNLADKAKQKNKFFIRKDPEKDLNGKDKKKKKGTKLDPFTRTETRSTFLDALMGGGGINAQTPKSPVEQTFGSKKVSEEDRLKQIKRKRKESEKTEKEAHQDVDIDVGDLLGGMDEIEFNFG